MTKLIGLYSSTPGHGKSTVAKILKESYGLKVHPFADASKKVCVTFVMQFGYTQEEAEHFIYVNKELSIRRIPGHPTGRQVQQGIATDGVRRGIHFDCWVAAWLASLTAQPTVADDLRFENEAAAIKDQGGELWEIIRPGHKAETHGHESEGRLDDLEFDRVILNNGTEEDLWARVAVALGYKVITVT